MNIKLALVTRKLLKVILSPIHMVVDTVDSTIYKLKSILKDHKLKNSTDEQAVKTTSKAIIRDIVRYKYCNDDLKVIVIADYVDTEYGLCSFDNLTTLGIFKNSYEASLHAKHIYNNVDLQIKVMEELKNTKHIDVYEMKESETNGFSSLDARNVIKAYALKLDA